MKIYFHYCTDGFTNSYTVVNDSPSVRQAIIVDPSTVDMQLINILEYGNYELVAVLITHNHSHHVSGIRTLCKLYSPTLYAADSSVLGMSCEVLSGSGTIRLAGLNVEFFSVPGHTPDSMVYKIGDALFTGDTLIPGMAGNTLSQYSHKLLCGRIKEKILTLPSHTVILPGHGSPGTIESECQFNLDVS